MMITASMIHNTDTPTMAKLTPNPIMEASTAWLTMVTKVLHRMQWIQGNKEYLQNILITDLRLTVQDIKNINQLCM